MDNYNEYGSAPRGDRGHRSLWWTLQGIFRDATMFDKISAGERYLPFLVVKVPDSAP